MITDAAQITLTKAVILELRSVTRCSIVVLVEEMNCSHTVFNLRSTWVNTNAMHRTYYHYLLTSFLESLSCS